MKKLENILSENMYRYNTKNLHEQTAPAPAAAPAVNANDGKDDLIEVLTNKLNSMKSNTNFNAMSVAQVIYNNCAHFMNKTDLFANRPGEPSATRVPFAPK